MTVPVYLTTPGPPHLSPVRQRMFDLCRARWREEPAAQLRIVTPTDAAASLTAFQRKRRVWADESAQAAQKASHGPTEPFYVLADDDCLPASPDSFLEEAVDILRERPEFAILSLLPTNAVIQPWRPDGTAHVPYEDAEVMEHVSVGGIRVCRAGCLEVWPEQAGKGYDREHCKALRRAGFRVGYFKNLKMHHLGEGYSTVW